MTLIELMVVIVILVTLVAGVLPLVSPNNDARKIHDAARSLQTYFTQAQSEAKRLGRPVGVGFRESAPGSGVALEVFQLAVPKPFTGPTITSRAVIAYPDGQYGDPVLKPQFVKNVPDPKGGTEFVELYGGQNVYLIRLRKAPLRKSNDEQKPFDYDRDYLPPGFFKIGDIADLDGNKFLIVDTDENEERFDPKKNPGGFSEFHGIWLNDNGQALRTIPAFGSTDPGVPKTYAVHRQPTTDKFGVSSESPYQLPTGIAIDLQASGVEGLGVPETFAENREVDSAHGQHNDYKPPTGHIKQIGIMFSPHGGIDGVWVNDEAVAGSATARSGNKLTDVSRIFLMLGRVENQNPPADTYIVTLDGNKSISDDELRTVRSKVNWLSPDSRWLVVNTQNGRVEVGQNAVYDPRLLDYDEVKSEYPPNLMNDLGRWEEACKIAQIEAAHGDAHGHQDEGTEP